MRLAIPFALLAVCSTGAAPPQAPLPPQGPPLVERVGTLETKVRDLEKQVSDLQGKKTVGEEYLPKPITGEKLWFPCQILVKTDRVTAYGSGTPIACEGDKTYILTNAHVVRKSQSTRPITVISQGKEYPAKYIDGSEVTDLGNGRIHIDGPDLALLEIDAVLGCVPIAERPPALGDAVRQWGFSHGKSDPVSRSGKVTGPSNKAGDWASWRFQFYW